MRMSAVSVSSANASVSTERTAGSAGQARARTLWSRPTSRLDSLPGYHPANESAKHRRLARLALWRQSLPGPDGGPYVDGHRDITTALPELEGDPHARRCRPRPHPRLPARLVHV